MNSHERDCSFAKMKTKDFHNILQVRTGSLNRFVLFYDIIIFQDRLQEEKTKVKLLENIYPYLSYNDAEFTGR